MQIVTTKQMRELEERSAKDYYIKAAQLMENAGIGIATWLDDFVKEKSISRDIVIICGGGNNAGDGFVSARILSRKGFKVTVVCLIAEKKLRDPARKNFSKLKKIKRIKIYKTLRKIEFDKIVDLFKNSNLILDCILGTGMRREVSGFYHDIIKYINSLSQRVIAVDVPSGLAGDTGVGFCIKAYVTLTLGLPKVGLLKPAAADAVGYLSIIDIGLPKALLNNFKTKFRYLQAEDFRETLLPRACSAHKGTFGHVLVLAGSSQYTGAAALCALGALRAGAGLVTLGTPRHLQTIFQIKLTESMTLGLPETTAGTLSVGAYSKIMRFIEKVDCVALGPGLSQNPDTFKLIRKVISSSPKPVVIDADAINALADDLSVLRKAKGDLILTPHPGEMAKLLRTSKKSVLEDSWTIARSLADKYGITIVLKGAHSVIAGADKNIYLNSSGNPGMASGGMGDILTGLIAGFIGQGIDILESVKFAVYIHGIAGDLAAREKGEVSLLAGDLLEKIPLAIKKIYDK